MTSPYESVIRDLHKKSRRDKKLPQILKWREYYREAGPVVFAQNELACPPDVPNHPVLGRPHWTIFSPDQIEFLTDLWHGQKLSLVSAARGCGKTFCLAIYVCWKVACFEDFEATCMGGSSPQSEIIQRYIDFWRLKNDNLQYCIPRSTGGIKPRIYSRWNALASFIPCSAISSRGPHVKLVVIDEVCAAEEKGIEGQKAVKAAWWQVLGKEDAQLIMTSTAHFIFGTFYDYYTGTAGKDFKKYRWAIAKHLSGEDNPYKIYQDNNPDNWSPNVWWVADEDIKLLRKAKSDDEWVCEALGGLSTLSGRMFREDDLKIAVCDLCEDCHPYTEKCKLMEKYGLGEYTQLISERVAGIDWGRVSDPNAIVVLGRKGDTVFVLFAEEMMSVVTEEMLGWADGHLRMWNIDYVYPDPQERALGQALEATGDYSVLYIWQVLGGATLAKIDLMINVKRFFEKRLIVIPKCYEELIHSLRQMAVGTDGRPIKRHDHSYDALSYALWEFKMDESFSEFWKVPRDEREVKNIW